MFPWKQNNRSRWRTHGLLAAGMLGTCALTGLSAGAEQPPKPVIKVPLAELGFPGYPVSLLHAGASMATVHMLDSNHILFTYSLRSLVPRLPGDDANDTDRQVAAVLVEVASGKVLARTKWHLHDHARYLWNVGHGVFVVRSGSDLSIFAPLAALAHGEDAFSHLTLPHRSGQPVMVEGSPDGRVITVELESNLPAAMGDEEQDEHKRKHYTLEFFRLDMEEKAQAPLKLSGAGAIGSPVLLRLAMDGDGYLWAEDGERGKWTVSFNEFGGKQEKLAPVMSSCHPRLDLLSRSQFLVETCRGSDLSPMFSAFGFDGHENWEEQFGEALQPPTLSLAPEAGRFAMSRLVATSSGAPTSSLANGDPISQEIRVYQTESGDLLLHLQCAPAVRSAENFDLSPDGKTLAVLGPETIDMYRLPELTAKDRKDLAEVRTMTPPEGSGPVALARITRPTAAPEPVSGGDAVHAKDEPSANPANPARMKLPMPGSTGAAAPATVAATEKVPTAKSEPGVVDGDPAAAKPRKAPTLLNPGESPEFKVPSSEPK